MSTRVYVPSDSIARSLGADAVANAITDLQLDIELVRNGSRGLYWLEPLLEIESEAGRIGFGPISADMVPDLFAGGIPDGGTPGGGIPGGGIPGGGIPGGGIPGGGTPDGGIPAESQGACLGLVEQLEYLQGQHRVTTSRVGIIDPLSIADYRAHGGFAGLEKARQMTSQEIVSEVTASGLRGRGGAAFPTGIKWQTVLDTAAERKYIVCNADEGDSGTFVDRMLMESDPFQLIEGMAIAGLAVAADSGFIYCRAEYPQALETLHRAVSLAAEAGYLQDFSLEVREAAGAYICGEETSMLESLEGNRGMVRFRPPLPATEGLFGQPTVVNNVVSLATVPRILAEGAGAYNTLGVGRSQGTLTVQLAGNIRCGGLVEIPFGITLREVLDRYGGGSASGQPIKAVQAGGPLGAYIPPQHFDTPLDYEAFREIGAMLGHGGLVVFDDTADLGQMARFAMEFCALESCGKCTPCRIGSVRGVEVIDRIRANDDADANRILLKDLCNTMIDGSLCALGGMAPFPVLSVMEHFTGEL